VYMLVADSVVSIASMRCPSALSAAIAATELLKCRDGTVSRLLNAVLRSLSSPAPTAITGHDTEEQQCQ
jgi:hypothetical protein